MDPSGKNDLKVFDLRLEHGSGSQEVHGFSQPVVHDPSRVGNVVERDGKVVDVAVVVPEMHHEFFILRKNCPKISL